MLKRSIHLVPYANHIKDKVPLQAQLIISQIKHKTLHKKELPHNAPERPKPVPDVNE